MCAVDVAALTIRVQAVRVFNADIGSVREGEQVFIVGGNEADAAPGFRHVAIKGFAPVSIDACIGGVGGYLMAHDIAVLFRIDAETVLCTVAERAIGKCLADLQERAAVMDKARCRIAEMEHLLHEVKVCGKLVRMERCIIRCPRRVACFGAGGNKADTAGLSGKLGALRVGVQAFLRR